LREGEAGIADEYRRAELERLLDVCRGWTLKPEEKAQLDGES